MLTSGFFNSLNGDRKYDAEQLSSIFDGIIQDGVYETIGDCFVVSPGEGMSVYVGTGRAWFNHAWTLNDSRYPLNLDPAETGLNRIDLVVLEVNSNEDSRKCSLKIVTGTPAVYPVRPEIADSGNIHQHILAEIYVGTEVTGIAASAITNRVGTSDCPFVIGVIEIMTIDQIVAQWDGEFAEWMNDNESEFRAWYQPFTLASQAQFDLWFANLQYVLDGDVAGHLQNQIDAVRPMTNIEIDSIWDSVFNPVEEEGE